MPVSRASFGLLSWQQWISSIKLPQLSPSCRNTLLALKSVHTTYFGGKRNHSFLYVNFHALLYSCWGLRVSPHLLLMGCTQWPSWKEDGMGREKWRKLANSLSQMTKVDITLRICVRSLFLTGHNKVALHLSGFPPKCKNPVWSRENHEANLHERYLQDAWRTKEGIVIQNRDRCEKPSHPEGVCGMVFWDRGRRLD